MPLRWRREIGGPSHGAHPCPELPPARHGPVMTTIRVTRRAGVLPVPAEGTAAPSARGREGAVRLELVDPPAAAQSGTRDPSPEPAPAHG